MEMEGLQEIYETQTDVDIDKYNSQIVPPQLHSSSSQHQQNEIIAETKNLSDVYQNLVQQTAKEKVKGTTISQRILYLKQELGDLENDITTQKKMHKFNENLSSSLEEVQQMQQKLQSLVHQELVESLQSNLDVKSLVQQLSQVQSQNQQNIIYELYCGVDTQQLQQQSLLAMLETKIAKLEEKLGNWTSGTSIHQTVDTLWEKVQLLDSKKLDLLDRQARKVGQELEALQTNLSMQSSQQSFKKIDELYEMLDKSLSIVTEVPKIVERLQQLKDVHIKCANFAQRLEFLEKQQESMNEMLIQDQKLLIEVQNGLAQNVTLMDQNFVVIEEKMKKALSPSQK